MNVLVHHRWRRGVVLFTTFSLAVASNLSFFFLIGPVPSVAADHGPAHLDPIVTKSATIGADANSNGLLEPGDELDFTITISNVDIVPLDNVSVSDPVPIETTYVSASSTLEGVAIADDLTPPQSDGIPIRRGWVLRRNDRCW